LPKKIAVFTCLILFDNVMWLTRYVVQNKVSPTVTWSLYHFESTPTIYMFKISLVAESSIPEDTSTADENNTRVLK